jgi:hypothetical protein
MVQTHSISWSIWSVILRTSDAVRLLRNSAMHISYEAQVRGSQLVIQQVMVSAYIRTDFESVNMV